MNEIKERLRFDATITLGDMVTAILLLIGGISAYWTLSTRVSILEEYRAAHSKQAEEQQQAQKEALGYLRDDIREVQRGVNALTLMARDKK